MAAPKLTEQEKKDRLKVTDFIQSMWGEDANWKLLTAQLKSIMKEYELTHKDVYYILKYCKNYEQVVIDGEYGLYQLFPKYIDATQMFRDKLAEAKEKADEIGTTLPIKVKKYQPKRKIKDDLTFD